MKVRLMSGGIAALALAAAGMLAAGSAQAAPVEVGPGTITHCVLEPGGGTSCGTPAQMASRTAKIPLLIRVHDLKNQRGDQAFLFGPRCSEGTGDIDYVLNLGAMAGRGESVTKGPEGNCNWQLVGSAGKRSTWVEGSRDTLGNLGDGWNNRAVSVRLT